MKKTIIFCYSIVTMAFIISCISKPAVSDSTQNVVDITGKTWKLTELNGQPITLKNPEANPYFKLNTSDMRYEGHGGFNGVGGTYELKSNVMRIKFNQGMSTMIACDDLETERSFVQALLAADNYSVNGNILTLNKAKMAPLAKFVLR
ncbi:META domain-containing protein [Chryseobacterium sp. SSA4.19]|uniref:META domain-containing protein n=1 Tax=Chryseobacterium sp. SSA4.19 TaxID=2919915 RepID=UPI001F4DB1BB|nr:META domain-containing protein [Chryseobacterium sp. SSA4.19]MCJ8153753.1 META domain-containing protein [Chryseobacterium sp. SSA4.19]